MTPAKRRPQASPTIVSDAQPNVAVLRRRLLRWYRVHRRDLPWRRTKDAYRIWISEIMLQQTRVDVVVPYYERFVERFPNVRALADAPLDDVLHVWSGLGYYTRARNLHAAARLVCTQHAGVFPDDFDGVVALPGIGRYTAGAILSIAFDQRHPIVDGNVTRVVSRLFSIDADVQSPATRKCIWEIAAEWARGRSPGDANQALMELGATLCNKPTPECARCPLRNECLARRNGTEQDLPRPRVRPAVDTVHLLAALVRRGNRLLLVRRESGRLLRDWWELPTCRLPAPPRHAATPLQVSMFEGACERGEPIAAALRLRLGVRTGALRFAGQVRHGVLSHRLEVQLVVGESNARDSRRARRRVNPQGAAPERRKGIAPAPTSRTKPTPLANLELEELGTRWVTPAECQQLPLSTLARKALRCVASLGSAWSQKLDAGERQSTAHERRRNPSK